MEKVKMKPTQAAAILHVSTRRVQYLAKSGQLKGHQSPSGRWTLDADSVQAYADSERKAGAPIRSTGERAEYQREYMQRRRTKKGNIMQEQDPDGTAIPMPEEGDDASIPEEPEQTGGDDLETPDYTQDSPGAPAPPVIRDPVDGRELPCYHPGVNECLVKPT